MTKLKGAFLALASTVAFVPSIAMAQSSMTSALTGPDSGWYVGGGIGQSSVDIDMAGTAPGSSVDDKDTSFRVFGGYQINKHFGVELGYSDLGAGTVSEPGFGQTKFESKAWDLVVVGTLPIAEKFSLIGKIGFYKGDLDVSDATGGISESTTDLTYTIGAGYDFNKNLGLRAEWQRYSKMGNKDTVGESDIDVIGISVVYRFR